MVKPMGAPVADNMKKDKLIHWIATGIVCSVMVFSAVNFNLSNPLGPMKGAFAHLGFPNYFKIINFSVCGWLLLNRLGN